MPITRMFPGLGRSTYRNCADLAATPHGVSPQQTGNLLTASPIMLELRALIFFSKRQRGRRDFPL
jgi:hypothetical protein